MFTRSSRISRCQKGFTVIEILTAAVLSAMLLALFMALTVKFVAIFDRLRVGESRIRDIANRALDRIETDLSGAYIDSKDPTIECIAYWDHPKYASQTLGALKNTGSESGLNEEFLPAKSGILLFYTKTLLRSGELEGDVEAVGYRLAYEDAISQNDDSNFKTFNLYRIANSPKVTSLILSPQSSKSDIAVHWKGQGSLDQLDNNEVKSYAINDYSSKFLIARNVVDFRVSFTCSCFIPNDFDEERFFTLPPSDDLTNPQNTFLRVGGDYGTNDTSSYSLPSIIPRDVRVYPTAIEVSITLLSEAGMKIFRGVNDGNLPKARAENLGQLIEEHGLSFTRMVKLHRQI